MNNGYSLRRTTPKFILLFQPRQDNCNAMPFSHNEKEAPVVKRRRIEGILRAHEGSAPGARIAAKILREKPSFNFWREGSPKKPKISKSEKKEKSPNVGTEKSAPINSSENSRAAQRRAR